MICAGIDVGSRTIKMVLMDGENQNVVASGWVDQGVEQDRLVSELLDQLVEQVGIGTNDLGKVVATGYGRDGLEIADKTITEIACHARGVFHQAPGTMTVIDIGGQDSKVIRLEKDGRVRDFVMNDRCAAGTGRFLEVVATRFDVALSDIGQIAEQAVEPTPISSMCVVFAETEIVGLVASRETPADIVAGVQVAIASRVSSMVGRKAVEPIIFTGGVALIRGMAQAIESEIGHPVSIATNPQFTGALGAALLACESV